MDDFEILSDLEEQLREEREEKQKKLDSMSEKELYNYYNESTRMVEEYAKKRNKPVVKVKAENKQKGGKN